MNIAQRLMMAAGAVGGGGEPPVIKNPPLLGAGGSGTSATVPLPANVAGDLLIVAIAGAGAATGYTTPAGWVLLKVNFKFAVFYRISTGGLASVVIPFVGGSLEVNYAAVCVDKATLGAPLVVKGDVVDSALNCPTVTITGADALLELAFSWMNEATAFPLPDYQLKSPVSPFLGMLMNMCSGSVQGDTASPGVFPPLNTLFTVAVKGISEPYSGGSPDQNWVLSASLLPLLANYMAATTLPDGRILIAGGNTASGTPNVIANTYLGTVAGNDVAWVASTALPAAIRTSGIVTLSDGRVLMVGGQNASSVGQTTVRFLTASGNVITYAAGTALPVGIACPTVLELLDGRVMVLGATTGAVYIGTISGNTITWVTSTALPSALYAIANSGYVRSDGRVVFVGATSALAPAEYIGDVSGNTVVWTKAAESFASSPTRFMSRRGYVCYFSSSSGYSYNGEEAILAATLPGAANGSNAAGVTLNDGRMVLLGLNGRSQAIHITTD